ncbi:GNAT family N-acetyltransferase [Bacillus sp. FJAT-42315]|uniref:GNAT family N-acetyltransferase n=1 Tax=Bacillus sp. FJAT-42315 TaxID=2014077 RepID=UPI000BA97CEE|nr:GNAT family N-acetyltransferase [Bacillus sp. FJAT-42315]PAQ12633.1 GNAT family N-acetyltransferase [Bacillaceae bacterium SAOS 7]
MQLPVKNLKVNFKTIEEFKSFKEYGLEELSMLEEIQITMVEDNANSPFYGIYYGDKLAARMCLYVKQNRANLLKNGSDRYLEIWKLEVLPQFQHKGFGLQLVNFAKSFNLPILTKARVKSNSFWEKMNFVPLSEHSSRLLWDPNSIITQKIS